MQKQSHSLTSNILTYKKAPKERKGNLSEFRVNLTAPLNMEVNFLITGHCISHLPSDLVTNLVLPIVLQSNTKTS